MPVSGTLILRKGSNRLMLINESKFSCNEPNPHLKRKNIHQNINTVKNDANNLDFIEKPNK